MECLNTLLLAPWRTLTREEQRTALQEARRRGRCSHLCHVQRCAMDREPCRAARPRDYLGATLPMATPSLAHLWRRRSLGELLRDPRVCAFADAWERERRSRLGLSQLPQDAASLRRLLAEAAVAVLAARTAYRLRAVRAARSGAFGEERVHIALGIAYQRLEHARDRHFLIRMLFGANLEGKTPSNVEP